MLASSLKARACLRDVATGLLHVLGLTRPARAGGALTILTFHRVLPEAKLEEYPLPELAVEPEALAFVLDHASRHYRCGSLVESYRVWRGESESGPPLLAVTFDDGQLDNFLHARQVLDRFGMKATFFVPVEALETNGTLWHDRLAYALRAAGLQGSTRARQVLESFGLAPVSWPSQEISTLVERAKSLKGGARGALLDRLEEAMGGPTRPAWDGMMSLSQLAELARDGHEIGSHSMSHAILPALDDASIAREVSASRRLLQTRLGVEVESFCFPNGDRDPRTLEHVRRAGYRLAVTTQHGLNQAVHHALALSRIDVQRRHLNDAAGRLSRPRLAWRLSPLYRAPTRPRATSPTAAYLISQYPAPSHTFIRREVDAMRRAGVNVETFSIRRPRREELLCDRDRDDYASTWYVLPPSPSALLRSNAVLLWRRPPSYARALVASLRHRVPGLRALLWSGFYFLEGMSLAAELSKRNVRHLHTHFANASSHAAIAAATYLDINFSLTLHGLCDFEYPAGPLLEQKVRAACFVGCATQYGRAQAMRMCHPGLWDRLFVVRCGVDMACLPERDTEPRPRLRIICVGRFSPEKGQLGLLEAFARASRAGLDADLVLLGDGPDRDRIRASIERLSLSQRVQAPGRVSEATALAEVARSDLLVLASFMEGLPVVLMEALALEIPVIAPSIAGIPELVVHGETGVLFTAGAWDKLADRLVELGRDPALRRTLARAGRERVVQEFAIDQAIEPLRARIAASLRGDLTGSRPQQDARIEYVQDTETVARSGPRVSRGAWAEEPRGDAEPTAGLEELG